MTGPEREATELSLIPEILRRSMAGIAPHMRGTAEAVRAERALSGALREASASQSLPTQAAIARTVDALVSETETKAKFADRLGLVAYHFAKMVTDAEAIVIGSGSSLAIAIDVLLPALEPAAQNDLLDDAARKQALRLLRSAQARGLFPDINIEVRAA